MSTLCKYASGVYSALVIKQVQQIKFSKVWNYNLKLVGPTVNFREMLKLIRYTKIPL